MGFSVRFTQQARDDLAHLYDWLLQRAEGDFTVAERALQSIRDGVTVLELAPLSCRKAGVADPFLRELVIGFGASGYVLLFEVESDQVVTVLAVRHQREDDYH
ncbi:type II toxin-antitoxin system RelE/ParE family toxin [Xanthomonas hortorum pv. vitians]|uniref:Type II toxin-antitoxin system RelE/ParE family toxin n=1 Tax=Xanthomonas hortorum pv. vitians TaxID=83224 RepID=A0A6V7D5K0_9XANT|nr:type II toxin-antitoxin system RelE/ParE family toxin [Xanthomonas hortorum]APP83933.1 plasmid stabilization protein [Xanthomonas hortorum pv. gardneri]ASW46146.1 plasmid stabilization protein [Xanthomonas hortorum]MCC8495212.1 type II toxin-antitoxin system RelE/ParE family toxin [Xanthomonas hortorum pv. gardneri]MCE4279717.1 type II toxin-antitoxin system RelE/ParE family toxin [Xanthomonas hortorum pv. vitians]MCE4286288.1 type II toxin-antitoxin system RelE/ParE family toxin [Xanthomon